MENTKTQLYRWDDMPKEKLSDSLSRRLVTADRMMLAHVYLDKGCVVPKHSHENEQLTYILEGALHFWIGENGERGDHCQGRRSARHSFECSSQGRAIEDTLDVDVFSPPRQDWLDKTDDYLREK
jgi:hypothetical protein